MHDAGQSLIAFTRSGGEKQVFVLINVTGREVMYEDPLIRGKDLLDETSQITPGRIVLRPYQAVWFCDRPEQQKG